MILGRKKKKRKFRRSAFNTRIPDITYIKVAQMLYKGVVLGTISEERNDKGQVDWIIKPNWEACWFWGHFGIVIEGIDYDLELDEYIRTELPEFINVRSLPDERACLNAELAAVGLTTNDRFEFMCRHNGITGVSPIYVNKIGEYRV